MSVIKLGNQEHYSRVRALALAFSAPAPDEPNELQAELGVLREDVKKLRDEIRKNEQEIARLTSELPTVRAEGEAAGHIAGINDADRRETERLEVLVKGVELANGALGRELESLERLAPLLAEQGLSRLFDDKSNYRQVAAAIIERQISGLRSQAVLAVEVSHDDFPDQSALDQVSFQTAGGRVVCVPELQSGDCRIRLKLGTLEVGIAQQWGEIRKLLSDLAEAPDADA